MGEVIGYARVSTAMGGLAARLAGGGAGRVGHRVDHRVAQRRVDPTNSSGPSGPFWLRAIGLGRHAL